MAVLVALAFLGGAVATPRSLRGPAPQGASGYSSPLNGSDASGACTPPWDDAWTQDSQNCYWTHYCCEPQTACYRKVGTWAGCLPSCTPGVHQAERPEYRYPWSCELLGPAPVGPSPAPAPAPAPAGRRRRTAGYHPENPQLRNGSHAPVHSFYMYRAQNDNNYPPENVNTGNLAGVLWYLQHEVVTLYPPKFGITRIVRLKVKTKATTPLFEKGMSFGARFAFDSGECTGPYSPGKTDCQDAWRKYGYFVGCNYLGDWPYPKFDTHYEGGIWYTLPGVCPSMVYSNMTDECQAREPGGACEGTPTGAGDCTYSYELAGEISLEELQGDHGRDFWQNASSDERNSWRVAEAAARFSSKYAHAPGDEDMQAPPCDFERGSFYPTN